MPTDNPGDAALRNPPQDDQDAKKEAADKDHDAEVHRAAKKLTEESPANLERIVEFMAMGSNVANPINPIHQKMTPEHISKVLDLAVQHDDRQFQLSKKNLEIHASNRWFGLVIFLVCVASVLTIVIMFKSDTNFIEKFFAAIFAFGAGFGSGWGVANKSKKQSRNG